MEKRPTKRELGVTQEIRTPERAVAEMGERVNKARERNDARIDNIGSQMEGLPPDQQREIQEGLNEINEIRNETVEEIPPETVERVKNYVEALFDHYGFTTESYHLMIENLSDKENFDGYTKEDFQNAFDGYTDAAFDYVMAEPSQRPNIKLKLHEAMKKLRLMALSVERDIQRESGKETKVWGRDSAKDEPFKFEEPLSEEELAEMGMRRWDVEPALRSPEPSGPMKRIDVDPALKPPETTKDAPRRWDVDTFGSEEQSETPEDDEIVLPKRRWDF